MTETDGMIQGIVEKHRRAIGIVHSQRTARFIGDDPICLPYPGAVILLGDAGNICAMYQVCVYNGASITAVNTICAAPVGIDPLLFIRHRHAQIK